MVVGEASINNIMGGIENTGSVRLHNHKKKLKQRFDIIKKLGQGTYGKVQLGINKETGQEVAIKTIKKSKIETEADLIRIRREIQIMSSVQHPNIIHIYEVFENREKMVLVMEYAAGGELYDYLSERKVLIETEARRIFRQIATACYYCHKHKICHRDLKLENILLDETGNAKIADFGLSNVFDDQRLLSTFCGSPLYASPEIVKGTPYIGPEVDCWSLGVLLYTLVYGAMPFDGSNFKRLVKQISTSDYSEPKKPSAASPLIREMLDVSPQKRANIERICEHWWVNEGYSESCLDISEDLANQTPVRLDLLLSLAPPPPQLGESDKLVVTGDLPEESMSTEQHVPTRSQSVGSIIELTNPAERRIKDLIAEELKSSPKRKLETTVSTDQANLPFDTKQRKDKIVKENTVADISVHSNIPEEDIAMTEIPASTSSSLDRSLTQTITKNDSVTMDTQEPEEELGAACVELIEEQQAKKNKVAAKVKRTQSTKVLEEINENPSQEKENAEEERQEKKVEVEVKVPAVKKVVVTKKKVLGDKNENETEKKTVKKVLKPKSDATTKAVAKPQVEPTKTVVETTVETVKPVDKVPAKPETKKVASPEESKPPTVGKPAAQRRSTIFEQAEKFQNMFTSASKSNVPTAAAANGSSSGEKSKKPMVIPGVSVGGFKREFERKASLTSTSPPKLRSTPSKKLVIDDKASSVDVEDEVVTQSVDEKPSAKTSPTTSKTESTPTQSPKQVSPVTPTKPSPTPNTTKSPSTTIKSPETTKPTTALRQTTTTSSNSSSASSPEDNSVASIANAANVANVAGVTNVASAANVANVATNVTGVVVPEDDDHKKKLKNAVSIIGSALDMDGTRKSKSRPCMQRKPPVPFGVGGRSASGSIGMISPPGGEQRKFLKMHSIPASVIPIQPTSDPPECQTSIAEITLKSATLPRRKTTKAEIKLDYPSPPTNSPHPATMEFKTEMAHHVQVAPAAAAAAKRLETQRSEATFPIFAPQSIGLRSLSLEPESRMSPKERIIPISFERSDDRKEVISPPVRPPLSRGSFSTQKPNLTQRSHSLSRQSTQDSDTESTVTSAGDPIRKSPREYIIPIAVEGGGYVTPRAGSLEPSESSTTTNTATTASGVNSRAKFGRRWKTPFGDRDGSEDESPFPTFQRYSSFGKDSDNEDSHKDPFHMHRLRSSRPRKAHMEHTDSVSSGEDDDDDGFEILTAENLFSTLLSRVRDLTQRLKVDEGGRPGFPSSRLLSHFDHHGSNFFSNLHPPLSRNSPVGRSFNREHSATGSTSHFGAPWRRSVSRDLASDIQSVFTGGSGEQNAASSSSTGPTVTATLPRGDRSSAGKSTSTTTASNTTSKDSLNLTDLNMKKLKLTEEDALALSFLTPGLSRRIQKQLFAQLPASEARKLSRTMSMRNPDESNNPTNARFHSDSASSLHQRRSVDRIMSTTLPRKFSYDNEPVTSKYHTNANPLKNLNSNSTFDINQNDCSTTAKTYLPRRSKLLSKSDCGDSNLNKLRYLRTTSLKEPYETRYGSKSPDSSISESVSSYRNDDSTNTTASYSLSRPPSYSSYTDSSAKYSTRSSVEVDRALNNSAAEKKPNTATTQRKVSRFLRPDFYDSPPKEENLLHREKKEREMETQKVLKEIRDKRIKNRLTMRRERSISREKELDTQIESVKKSSANSAEAMAVFAGNACDATKTIPIYANDVITRDNIIGTPIIKDYVTNSLNTANTNSGYANVDQNTINNNLETAPLETKQKLVETIKSNGEIANNKVETVIPEYVNVPVVEKVAVKKDRLSKLVRPKSYPTERNGVLSPTNTPEKSVDLESKPKTSRLKKGLSTTTTTTTKTKEKPTTEPQVNKTSSKNKFLQTIEKKFEKLRSFSNNGETSEEKEKMKEEKATQKSGVESAIKKLRERSVPKQTEQLITESTLIKRAVSVEDVTNAQKAATTKALQPSRKSVTKILGLFKKYEDKDTKKANCVTVKKASSNNEDTKTPINDSQLVQKAVVVDDVAQLDEISESNIPKPKTKSVVIERKVRESLSPDTKTNSDSFPNEKERPKSLLFDHGKHVVATTNGTNGNDTKKSKLPLTSRRSLNLEETTVVKSVATQLDNANNNNTTAFSENSVINDIAQRRADRKGLKLDFSVIPKTNNPSETTTVIVDNNPLTPNRNLDDNSSTLLSPYGEDTVSCDSWSACSDFHHTNDLLSPQSQPNGNPFSEDESTTTGSESVIDRIRRKSFYTRFNDTARKRPRKTSLMTGNYRDLDLYKERDHSVTRKPATSYSKSSSNVDYGSLDRRSVDYRYSNAGLHDNGGSLGGGKREHRSYARSSSMLNDYVNVPTVAVTSTGGRYKSYGGCSNDGVGQFDELENGLDHDGLMAARYRKYSYNSQASRVSSARSSVSPSHDICQSSSITTSSTRENHA